MGYIEYGDETVNTFAWIKTLQSALGDYIDERSKLIKGIKKKKKRNRVTPDTSFADSNPTTLENPRILETKVFENPEKRKEDIYLTPGENISEAKGMDSIEKNISDLSLEVTGTISENSSNDHTEKPISLSPNENNLKPAIANSRSDTSNLSLSPSENTLEANIGNLTSNMSLSPGEGILEAKVNINRNNTRKISLSSSENIIETNTKNTEIKNIETPPVDDVVDADKIMAIKKALSSLGKNSSETTKKAEELIMANEELNRESFIFQKLSDKTKDIREISFETPKAEKPSLDTSEYINNSPTSYRKPKSPAVINKNHPMATSPLRKPAQAPMSIFKTPVHMVPKDKKDNKKNEPSKDKPIWTETPVLKNRLRIQEDLDAKDIFGSVKVVKLDDIFQKRKEDEIAKKLNFNK